MNGRRLPSALAGANVTGPARDRSTCCRGLLTGYRYVRKSDTSAAYYEVIEPEAAVVRRVYEMYTQQGFSINAIARLLNEEQIPTRTRTTRWERSTVWGCCATRPTGAGPAMGRPNSGRDNASREPCGNAGGGRAATVPTTSGLDPIGSRSRFRL